jgi:hypothetical protein
MGYINTIKSQLRLRPYQCFSLNHVGTPNGVVSSIEIRFSHWDAGGSFSLLPVNCSDHREEVMIPFTRIESSLLALADREDCSRISMG